MSIHRSSCATNTGGDAGMRFTACDCGAAAIQSMTPEAWDAEVARLQALKDNTCAEHGRRCEASTVLVRMHSVGTPKECSSVPSDWR